jgi:hypothetical protein
MICAALPRRTMGRRSASKTKSLQKAMQEKQRQKQRTAAFLSAIVGGAVVLQYMTPHLIKTPMYDPKLSGKFVAFVARLATGK